MKEYKNNDIISRFLSFLHKANAGGSLPVFTQGKANDNISLHLFCE